MIVAGMHIHFTSKLIIWLLYSAFHLRRTFLIQVCLQRYQESPFHINSHFLPLIFPFSPVICFSYLLICLKLELRSCGSACGWVVLLCKLAQDFLIFFFFLRQLITDNSWLTSISNTQSNSRSHQPRAPYQLQVKTAGKWAEKDGVTLSNICSSCSLACNLWTSVKGNNYQFIRTHDQ